MMCVRNPREDKGIKIVGFTMRTKAVVMAGKGGGGRGIGGQRGEEKGGAGDATAVPQQSQRNTADKV